MEKKYKEIKIGRVDLREGVNLIARVIDDKEIDLRVWMNTEEYKGPTKKGIRFNFFDGTWIQFKKLMEKVDKKYAKLVS